MREKRFYQKPEKKAEKMNPESSVVLSYEKQTPFEKCQRPGLTPIIVFPTCLGVNPMVSIMAFANRSADYIHEMKLS